MGKKRVVPKGKTLYPYQVEGVKFLAKRRRTLLGDEVGLGKTAQVIVTNNVWQPEYTVVVCPAALSFNWEREWGMWDVHGRDTCITGVQEYNGHKVIICSDHILTLKKLQVVLQKAGIKRFCLFVDEAHRLSSWDSQRTNFVTFNLVPKADFVVLMTGTPMQNGEIKKLHPLASICAPTRFGDERAFCERYSTPVWNGYKTEYKGVRNVARLKRHMADFMLRRFKRDVLKDLPEVTVSHVPVEIEGAIADESLKYVGLVEMLLEGRKQQVEVDTRKAFATARRELGEAKVDAVINFCEVLFEGGSGPVIIYGHHRSVVDDLFKGLAIGRRDRVARLWGGDDPKKKDDVVQKFQRGEIDYLVLSIDALSHGVTLTKSSCVVFAEPSIKPEAMEQGIGRVSRIGAKNAINVYCLIEKKSLDLKIYKMLGIKTGNIKKVVG